MSTFACGRCAECDGGRGFEFCLHPIGTGVVSRCACGRVFVLDEKAPAPAPEPRPLTRQEVMGFFGSDRFLALFDRAEKAELQRRELQNVLSKILATDAVRNEDEELEGEAHRVLAATQS